MPRAIVTHNDVTKVVLYDADDTFDVFKEKCISKFAELKDFRICLNRHLFPEVENTHEFDKDDTLILFEEEFLVLQDNVETVDTDDVLEVEAEVVPEVGGKNGTKRIAEAAPTEVDTDEEEDDVDDEEEDGVDDEDYDDDDDEDYDDEDYDDDDDEDYDDDDDEDYDDTQKKQPNRKRKAMEEFKNAAPEDLVSRCIKLWPRKMLRRAEKMATMSRDEAMQSIVSARAKSGYSFVITDDRGRKTHYASIDPVAQGKRKYGRVGYKGKMVATPEEAAMEVVSFITKVGKALLEHPSCDVRREPSVGDVITTDVDGVVCRHTIVSGPAPSTDPQKVKLVVTVQCPGCNGHIEFIAHQLGDLHSENANRCRRIKDHSRHEYHKEAMKKNESPFYDENEATEAKEYAKVLVELGVFSSEELALQAIVDGMSGRGPRAHIDAMKDIVKKSGFEAREDIDRACEQAAAKGHFSTLKYFGSMYHCFRNECTSAAARAGHMDILQWLLTECPFSPVMDARDEEFTLLRWAHWNGCPLTERMIALALREPNIPMLSWLKERGCPWPDLSYAEFGGCYLEVIRWMLENGQSNGDWILGLAVYCRNVDALQWLKENGYTNGSLDDEELYSIAWGHDDECVDEDLMCTFDWLHANGCPITEGVLRSYDHEEEVHKWLKRKLYGNEKATASRLPCRGGKGYRRKQVESAPAVKRARRS